MASPAAVLTILVNASTRSAQAAADRARPGGARSASMAQRNALRTASAYEAAGKRVGSAGRTLTRNISVPAAAAGAISVKMAMDFEESMTKIQNLVGASSDQVGSGRKEMLKLGPELGKSPQELADALYFVTSSGIEAADAMEVLTVTAKASAIGLGETKVVADAVTSAMNAYKKSGLSAADATNVLRQGGQAREGRARGLGGVDRPGDPGGLQAGCSVPRCGRLAGRPHPAGPRCRRGDHRAAGGVHGCPASRAAGRETRWRGSASRPRSYARPWMRRAPWRCSDC